SNDSHVDQLIYEVKKPLDAEQFFNDPMLSMYLFTKIGSTSFNKKRKYWKYPSLRQNITNVSRKFTEVCSNFSLQPFNIRYDSYLGINKSGGSYVELDDFDFEVLFTHLK